MEKNKISIVVPVYNAEKYLEECIYSLISQTYKDIEILCVDNDSSDTSTDILERYSKQDKRIKIFYQHPNVGVGGARNIGLKNASGEYLMFCDADDTYEPTMCEEMYKAISQNNVDYAECQFRPVYYHGNGRSLSYLDPHKFIGYGKQYLTNFFKIKTSVMVWKKIFKMELVKKYDICFPEKIFFEDTSFVNQYLSVSASAFFIRRPLYNYRILANSGVSLLQRDRPKWDFVNFIKFTTDFMVRNGIIKKNISWYTKFINIVLNGFCRAHLKDEHKLFLQKINSEILCHFTFEDLKSYDLLYLCKKGKYQEAISKYCKNIQPQSASKTTKTKKPFFGKTKSADGKEITSYFFGIPVVKRKILEGAENYYLFGKKLYTGLRYDSIKNLQDKLTQIENKLKAIEIKQNTNIKTNFYSQGSNENKLIICFDSLASPHCECAHAYALFKELQSKEIPSKYVALKLAASYQTYLEGQKDIIAVSSAAEFINNYAHIINRSSQIYAGASLGDAFDRALASLSYLDYIYLGSGALGLKKWKIREIIPARFNKIYAPTKISLQAIKSLNIWEDDDIIAKPLPLWNELNKHNNVAKNNEIFIFFSWRTSFRADKNMAKKYLQSISDFISKLKSQIDKDIKITLAWHHKLILQNIELPAKIDGVEIISSHIISEKIKSASMLITDYSSVCFDFMVQDKPVVFYRFDADELGLNDQDNMACVESMEYDEMLGNNVCYDEKSVFEQIKKYTSNSFETNTEQKELYKRYFLERTSNGTNKTSF